MDILGTAKGENPDKKMKKEGNRFLPIVIL